MRKLMMNLMMLFVLLTPITLHADSTSSTNETYEEGSIVSDVKTGTIIEIDLTFTTEGIEVEGFLGTNLDLVKEELKESGAELSDDDILNAIKSIMPSAKIIEIDGTKVIRLFDSMDLEEIIDEEMGMSDLVNSDGTLNLNNVEIIMPLGDLQQASNFNYSLGRKLGNSSDINSISVGLKVNTQEGYKIVDNNVGTIENGSLVYAATDYDGIDDLTFKIKKDTIFTPEFLLLIGGILILIALIVIIVVLIKASKKNNNQPQGPVGPNPVGPMNPNNNMPINNQGVQTNNQNVMPPQQPQAPQMNQVNNPQVQPVIKPNPQVVNKQPVDQPVAKPQVTPTPQVVTNNVEVNQQPNVVNHDNSLEKPVVKPQVTPTPQVVTNNVEVNQQPGSVNNNPLEKTVVNNSQDQDVNNGLNN